MSEKKPTSAKRQQRYRESQHKLGRRGYLYYLTPQEKAIFDQYLEALRRDSK